MFVEAARFQKYFKCLCLHQKRLLFVQLISACLLVIFCRTSDAYSALFIHILPTSWRRKKCVIYRECVCVINLRRSGTNPDLPRWNRRPSHSQIQSGILECVAFWLIPNRQDSCWHYEVFKEEKMINRLYSYPLSPEMLP